MGRENSHAVPPKFSKANLLEVSLCYPCCP